MIFKINSAGENFLSEHALFRIVKVLLNHFLFLKGTEKYQSVQFFRTYVFFVRGSKITFVLHV